MAGSDLTVRISAQDNASATFAKVASSAQTMSQALEGVGKGGASGIQDFSAAVGELEGQLNTVGQALTGMGAAGTAFFGFAANASMNFETSLANVNSIARLTEGEMDSLQASVQALSQELGASPTGLADALYDIQSAGFATADAMEILEKSAIAGKAGLTDTATAATAVTAVLNAYKLTAQDAGDVSDVLFKTVDSGNIKFGELATNLGRVLPVAASLKVSIEEIGAAFAQLTLVGIGPSEAETGIASLMQRALAPTEAMTEAVTEYGFASAEALIQSQGLAGYLEFLAEASGGTASGLQLLLGDVTAVNAALALTANNGAGYTAMLGEMSNAAQEGAYTQEVMAIQMDTTAASIDKLQAAFASMQITMGDALSPFIRLAADGLTQVAAGFNALPGPIQSVVAVMGAMGSVATLATGAFILAIPKLVEFRNAMVAIGGTQGVLSMLRGGFMGIVGSINPVVLAFAGLTAAGVVAWSMFQDGKDRAQQLETALISLGDVAENLRLVGRDAEAGMVDVFEENVRNVLESADELLHNEDLLWSMAEQQAASSGEAVIDVYTRLAQAYALNNEEVTALTTAQGKISAAFSNSLVDHEALNDALTTLINQYRDGEITLDQFVAGMVDIGDNISRYREGADAATASTKTLTEAVKGTAQAMAEAAAAAAKARSEIVPLFGEMANSGKDAGAVAEIVADRYRDLFDTLAGGKARQASDFQLQQIEALNQATTDWISSSADIGQFLDFWLDLNAALTETDAAQQQATASVRDLMQSGIEIGDTWGGNVVTLGSLRGEVGRLGENVEAADRSFEGLIAQGGELASFGDGLRRIGTEVAAWDFSAIVGMANGIEDAGRALDSVLATFGRIDDLGSRSESANSIAEDLIGTEGEWATIDDLVTNAAISVETYNAAVDAGYRIQAANLAVQEDLNAIRAAQLPLLAAEEEAYAANIDRLAQLPAEQQRYALALQDTAVQQQLAAQYATAYSASVGEIPEQVATDIIVNTAEADPLIGDMLVKMGLLNEVWGPDGTKTYTVNFPDGETVQESISELTKSIDALTEAMGDVPPLHLETNAGEIADEVGVAIGDLTRNLPDKIDIPLSIAGAGISDNLTGLIPDDLSIDLAVNADTSAIPAAIAAATSGIGAIVAPVEADTEPARAMITTLADDVPTVTVPVQLDLGGLGGNARGAAGDMARAALGNVADVVTITIVADDQAASVIDGYKALDGTSLATMSVTIDLTDNAADKIAYYESPKGGNGAPLGTMTVTIDAVDNASSIITDVTNAANAIPDSESVEVSAPGAAIATSLLSGVTGAALSIPDSASVSVSAPGAADAASALYAVASAANSIPSSVSTTVTTNVVTAYSTIGSPSGFSAVRHGGIPAFAGGGLFRAGEAGYEEAIFPGGRVLPLPTDGLYATAQAPYVRPHNAVSGGGGIVVNVHVAGHVIGVSDLTERIASELLPAMASEHRTYRTAITGGMV